MSSHLIHVWCLLIFQFILAGFLTHRIAEYSFDGELSIKGYVGYWMIFLFTGFILLMVALPLWVVGIRMFPVFVPKSMIWDPDKPEYDDSIFPVVRFFLRAAIILGAILYGVYIYASFFIAHWLVTALVVSVILFIAYWF